MKLNELKNLRTGLSGDLISEEEWFKERFFQPEKWEDTPQGIIVQRSLNLSNTSQIEVPVRLARIEGDFYIAHSSLTSMKNFPDYVKGDFDLNATSIKSFIGGPSYVGKSVYGENTLLENLEGAPAYIGKNCMLRKNQNLKSLAGTLKKVVGFFSISDCKQLKDLSGSPEEVGEWDSSRCDSLQSLKGISPIIHGDVYISGCPNLESLKGLKTCGNTLTLKHCPKIKNVLFIFNIKGLKHVSHDNNKLRKILNKYLEKRDMLNCQDELIEAGLEEYAEIE